MWEFPGGPVAESAVQSLVGELKSCESRGSAWGKKKKVGIMCPVHSP